MRREGVERLAAMHENAPSEVRIKVRASGPYLVTGPVRIVDADGNAYVTEGASVALCRCGGSQTKPFCDGSHKTNGFTAEERADAPAAT